MQNYLTRKEAAKALSVSEVTLDRLIRSQALKIIRMGRRVAVSAESLQEYVAGCGTDNEKARIER